jgi:virginiamycin B lyase
MRVVLAALLWAAAPAAPAAAASVEEIPLAPGVPAAGHQARFVAVGPEGAIWWSEGGSEPGIGRITTAGVRLGRIDDPDGPLDLLRGADGTMYWTAEHGLGRKPPGAPAETLARPGFSEAIGFSTGGALRWGESDAGAEVVLGFAGEAWGGMVEAVDAAAGEGTVTGMALGPDGRLCVAFPARDELRLLDPAGLGPATVVPLPPGSGPTRLARGPEGDLWVTEFDAAAIDRFAADGTRTRFPLPPGSGPFDVTAGPDGAIWFTEFGSGRIGRITASGEVSEYAIPAPHSRPMGITAGPDGALWFAESEAAALGRIVPDPPAAPAPGEGKGGGGEGTDRTPPRFLHPPRFAPRSFIPAIRAGARLLAAQSAHLEPPRVDVSIFVPGGRKSCRDGVKRLRGPCDPGGRVARDILEALPIRTGPDIAPSEPTGTRLAVALSEPATVTVAIRRAGDRRPLGTLRRRTGSSGATGAATLSLHFTGRAHGRPLAPGRYLARIRAIDAAGNASPARTAGFRILDPPPLPPR